jgi:hypothetical protein
MAHRHRPELSDSVSAEPVGANRRTPRTFRPGRRCAVPGCQTLLSIYNGAKHCAAHNPTHLRTTLPRPFPDTPAAPTASSQDEPAATGANRPRVRVLLDPDDSVSRRAS